MKNIWTNSSNFKWLRDLPFKARRLLQALPSSTLEISPYFPKSAFVCFVWVSENGDYFSTDCLRGIGKTVKTLASSCLSVRPHGITRLPLDGFS